MKNIEKQQDLAFRIFTELKSRSGRESVNLNQVTASVKKQFGIQAAYNFLMRLETALNFRKPRLGIYDNAFHFVGGAQKYGCTLAHALQDDFDVTLIGHRPVKQETLKQWYDIDLSRCRTKWISLPYFEKKHPEKEIFDAGEVDLRGENPFHAVSRESGNYDFFVNNCMLEMVYPLAHYSEFVCHFPERERSRFFHVDRYSHIIFNSLYTEKWIQKRWNLEPQVHIYPPVDMKPLEPPPQKQNILLSVSRFEPSGNKQQAEMARIFLYMKRNHPEKTESWKLVLAGGSIQDNPYLDRIKRIAAAGKGDIDIRVNIPVQELKNLYRDASLFWHFSGLRQIRPERIEHFGMTTVEAMQNGCVPIVFKGGGQREIVADGKDGVFFTTEKEAVESTLNLMGNAGRRKALSQVAFNRGNDFTRDVFIKRVRRHFMELLTHYRFKDA